MPREDYTQPQPWSPTLAALALLTGAADRVAYFTSATTMALATFTAQARTFVAAATQAAQRAVLGLDTGDIPTFAGLILTGGYTGPVATKVFADSPVTLVAGGTEQTIACNAVGGAITINLPALAGVLGRIYRFVKIDASTNLVILDANAAETIEGALTLPLPSQWSAVSLQATAAGWVVVDRWERPSSATIPGDFGDASTPSAAQFFAGWIPIVPTMATTCTTPTAALVVAAIPGAYVGQTFDILINVKAAFAVTLTPGAGVALNGSGVVGSAVAGAQAQRFRARLDNVTGGAEAITIFRG